MPLIYPVQEFDQYRNMASFWLLGEKISLNIRNRAIGRVGITAKCLA